MSMIISAANYFSSIRQITPTSGGEKQEQKPGEADVGKIRQSAESASLDQVNMGEDGVAVSEVSRQQGTERLTAQKRPAAPRTDTVEISEEGRTAYALLQDQRTESGVETEQAGEQDLSIYTDSELKQMYYSGEITRQEYEKETDKPLE